MINMKTILVDAVDTIISDTGVVDQEMYKLLETYPNPKIVLTNANDEQYITYGLKNVPYELFTLKHNPDKTDPEYFKQLFERFNLTADDVIYFEHTLAAVKSAELLGIKSYHFDSEKRDLDALKTFIDNNL